MAIATIEIREDISFEAGDLDPNAPVIRNAKILGTLSQNKRRYTPEAKMDAKPLYEGAKINLNHPTVPNTNRSVFDRFATLRNVQMVGEDLRGDIHYNPAHEFAKTFEWWARNDPKSIGLSHNAVGQGQDENGVFVVNKIVTVRSVDLVADPATTMGLYEEKQMDVPAAPPVAPEVKQAEAPATATENMVSKEDHNYKIGVLAHSICTDPALSLEVKKQKLLKAFNLLKDDEKTAMPESVQEYLGYKAKAPPVANPQPTTQTTTPVTEQVKPGIKTAKELVESIQKKLEAGKAEAKKIAEEVLAKSNQIVAERLLEESKLPKEAMTDLFVHRVKGARDEAHMKRLIEERRIDIGASTIAQKAPEAKTMDAKAFAASLLR